MACAHNVCHDFYDYSDENTRASLSIPAATMKTDSTRNLFFKYGKGSEATKSEFAHPNMNTARRKLMLKSYDLFILPKSTEQ